jgi:hypothetical protein
MNRIDGGQSAIFVQGRECLWPSRFDRAIRIATLVRERLMPADADQ